VFDVFGGQVEQCRGQLVVEDALGFALEALVVGLANAENRDNFVAHRGGDFIADDFEGFVEVHPSFGVADDGVVDELAQHRVADFTGERAGVFIIGVLGRQTEFATIEFDAYRLQGQQARCQNDLDGAVDRYAFV